MATATSTLKVNAFPKGVTNDQAQTILYGTCALSTSGTYITNGIPLNWSAMQNPDGSSFVPPFGPQTSTPITAYFTSAAGGVLGGTSANALLSYIYDGAHNTLRIWSGSVELSNAGTIAADTITFEVHFARGV